MSRAARRVADSPSVRATRGLYSIMLLAIWAMVCLVQLVRVVCSYVYLNRLKREVFRRAANYD